MKLTEWFDHETNPARPGVYEVMNASGNRGFAYFDGSLWGWRGDTKRQASRERETDGASQDKTWRGLAKKP